MNDSHRLPVGDHTYYHSRYFIEDDTVPEYTHASPAAYEAFRDIKYGIRIHWGVYCLKNIEASWPLLTQLDHAGRQEYQQLYKRFNPKDFSADKWMEFFQRVGLKMFAFTAKHHDGFCLFDTKSRVKQRVNWLEGPRIEDCDIAYSIMDTPLKRDIVKELCDAARRRDIKINMYFSHPDWYDADFRNYFHNPTASPDFFAHPEDYGNASGWLQPQIWPAPDPTQENFDRMMARYRTQLLEVLSNYGKIDMVCFDCWLGPKVWPKLRSAILEARKIQPDVMFRARGIGNYGDYYTPEDDIPGGPESNPVPWFVIHRLSRFFAYDPDASQYKDSEWIVKKLIDIVAKGGNLMVSYGPDEHGNFHPKAIEALEEAGRWLAVNGEAIYNTRPRDGELWREGMYVYFTRSKDRRWVYAIHTYLYGNKVHIYTVKPKPGSVIRMFGVDQPMTWTLEGNKLVVNLPFNLQDKTKRPGDHAVAFKIEVADE